MVVNEFEAFLNEFDVLLGDMQLAGVFGFFVIFYFLLLGWGILAYVLESVGMYTIAKRRGLNNPWLAWIPVGNVWILGLIGDKDAEKRTGRDAKLRIWMLVLLLVMMVLLVGIVVAAFTAGVSYAIAESSYNSSAQDTGMVSLLVMVFAYLLMVAVAIALSVVQYVASYRMFKSCRPEHATLYLVLSIFFSVTYPFFVFACRKHDAPQPVQYAVPQFPQQ